MPYPKNIRIETKIGPVLAAVTNAGHVYVYHVSGTPLTWRGVTYEIGFHLYRRPDGTFLPRPGNFYGDYERTDIYVRKASGSPLDNYPSPSAYNKVIAEVVKAAGEWAQNEYENGTAFVWAHEAENDTLDSQINEQIQALHQQIQELQDKLLVAKSRPLPPDNRRKWLSASTADEYENLFRGEYQRAALAERCDTPREEILSYFGLGEDVRTAVAKVLDAERMHDNGFNANEAGIHRDNCSWPEGTPQRAQWLKGWDSFEQLKPLLKEYGNPE
jgi:ribosome modulation factor